MEHPKECSCAIDLGYGFEAKLTVCNESLTVYISLISTEHCLGNLIEVIQAACEKEGIEFHDKKQHPASSQWHDLFADKSKTPSEIYHIIDSLEISMEQNTIFTVA